MQWPALGISTSYSQWPAIQILHKALHSLWNGQVQGQGRGNNWTHALIMLYFRWYPVVSHFNNPPQLDVLVPSARQCLVIGPGWKPCWGLTSSTLMESTMRDTHPVFYCFPPVHAAFAFAEPDGAPWVLRLPQTGVRAGHGREESHLDLLLHKVSEP